MNNRLKTLEQELEFVNDQMGTSYRIESLGTIHKGRGYAVVVPSGISGISKVSPSLTIAEIELYIAGMVEIAEYER
jgi:hypothetical protein